LKLAAGGGVGEVVVEGADGGEQGLIEAGAGVEAGFRGDIRPGVFGAVREDLCVGGIVLGGAPGESVRNMDEWMQEDKDGLEASFVGFDERDVVRRVSELLRLHGRGITGRGGERRVGRHLETGNRR